MTEDIVQARAVNGAGAVATEISLRYHDGREARARSGRPHPITAPDMSV